jgi:hypothetical protein
VSAAKLTERMQRYVEAVVAGATGVDACRSAGYQGSAAVLAARAYKLNAHPLVESRLAALRAQREAVAVMTKVEREQLLSTIARGQPVEHVLRDGTVVHAAADPRDRISAVHELGALAGDYIKRTREEGGGTITELVDMLAELDARAAAKATAPVIDATPPAPALPARSGAA